MKLELSFAELHNPLFLGGTNWGLKLQPNMGSKGKLELAYDRVEKELLIKANGKIAIIPTSNVASMTPMPDSLEHKLAHVDEMPINPTVNPAKGKPGPKPKLNAQAATPHDHVFAQAPGKTHD